VPRLRRLLALPCLVVLAAVLAPACSLGAGTGTCSGTLDVPDCWSGPFDLHPNFFAAVPDTTPEFPSVTSDALIIRIQNGGDYETFSDGLIILIDDAGEVRGDKALDGTLRPSLLGQQLLVALEPSVVPPGVPITPVAEPSIVHASLYLDNTCRTQNDSLYAMAAVSGVDPQGECTRPEAGDPPLACLGASASNALDGGADATASASGDGGEVNVTGIGVSTITFYSLFDGNPDEANASQRLTQADFELYIADPSEICPGGLGPPPRCRGHLKGSFKFYFQRGRPAQPFP
jgi:hypothetical protein